MLFHQFSFARKFIPRTRREAIVAAVDAISDGGAEFQRNGALQFNGEIGNAPAGVEVERRGNRSGGTRGNAARAGAAAVLFRWVGLKFNGRDDLADENPVAEISTDEIGV